MHQFDHLIIAILLADITTELFFPKFFEGTDVYDLASTLFGDGLLRVVMTMIFILVPLVILRIFLYGL